MVVLVSLGVKTLSYKDACAQSTILFEVFLVPVAIVQRVVCVSVCCICCLQEKESTT